MTPTVSSTTTTNPSAAAPAATQSTTGFGDNFSTFLKLLTTQLQNQDPMSPLDTNQFTQQLVSFAQVEQAINTNTKLASLVSLGQTNQAVAALPLVGRTVEYDSQQATLTSEGAKYSYTLPADGASTVLTISTTDGKVVWRGLGERTAGRHEFVWDGKNQNGASVPPGIYQLDVSSTKSDETNQTATITAFGKVDGIESKDNQTFLSIGSQKIATAKMLAVRDASTQ
jgi:flagellar basal-body rod modification protein FlgD